MLLCRRSVAIKLNVTVQADAATALCLERLELAHKQLREELRAIGATVTWLKGHQEAVMTDLNQLLVLLGVVDKRTSEIGSAVGRVGTTNSAIAESQAKLALAIAEVGTDLARLRDSLGGAGGLKPGEADAVRDALEAAAVKLEAQAGVATAAADALAQQQVALEAQAGVLEQLGKDDTLLPPDVGPDPAPPPQPPPQPEPVAAPDAPADPNAPRGAEPQVT